MNQAEIQNDHGTITSKLAQFMAIITLDLVSSCFVQFTCPNNGTLKANKGVDLNLHHILGFVFPGISALMHFLILFWTFTLLWKSWPFRFGQVNVLFN